MILGVLVLLALSLATGAEAQAKAYGVVPGKSRVMFEASHPLGDFSGATEEVAGEVRLDPSNIPLGVAGSVTVNPARLKTGNEARDRDLRKILETDRYGEIRFRIEDVQASFPSLAERADVQLKIRGVMLIRGVERVTTWTSRARLEAGKIWVRGEAELKLTEFGITPPKRLFLAVADVVRASFDLRLAPSE